MGYLFSLASLSKTATERGLDASEILLLVCGLVLAVGAAGEYLEDHNRLPYWMIWHRKPKLVFVWMVAISLIGEFIGDAGVFVFSGHLQTITDGEYADLNKEAGDARRDAGNANKDAGDAKERAGKLEVQAATLSKEVEDERTARVKIEAGVAWRRLTERQQSEIGSALRSFSSQAVSLWYAQGSPETSMFAADIAMALVQTRTLSVSPPGGVITMIEGGRFGGPVMRVDTGVRLQSTNDEASRALASAIIKELAVRGFDAARQKDPPFDPNPVPQVWVNVDPRPDGPQGEFKLAAQREAAKKKAANRK